MTKEFKSILVGKHTDRIESEKESWTRAIFALNHLATSWNLYFQEVLDLQELAVLMNVPDLKRHIEVKKIKENPRHSEFIKSMNVNIDKMIDFVVLDPFDHLLAAVANVKAAIYPDPLAELNKHKPVPAGKRPLPVVTEIEFNKWKYRIWDGLKFNFIPELESEITERHSVYTRNSRENAAYFYMLRLSETLNVLNDCGFALQTTEFPRSVFDQLKPDPTPKLHAELLHPMRGEKKYPIMHFTPELNILDKDSSILHLMTNLTDSEINELIEKLQP